MKLQRTLTIHKRLINYYLPNRTLIVPEIRLKGSWLEKWGFNCGDKITATKVDNEFILIKKKGYIPEVEI